jgi:hypothetical protein
VRDGLCGQALAACFNVRLVLPLLLHVYATYQQLWDVMYRLPAHCSTCMFNMHIPSWACCWCCCCPRRW